MPVLEVPLVANLLVTLNTDDDWILFQASVMSIIPVVDGLVVLDATPFGKPYFRSDLVTAFLRKLPISVTVERDQDIVALHGFSAARNRLLALSPKTCFILWVDSDEVHFPGVLLPIRQRLSLGDIDDVSTHFIHFCIGTNFYERFERRVNIFRRTPQTRWVRKVHEGISHCGFCEGDGRVHPGGNHVDYGCPECNPRPTDGPLRPRRILHSDYHYHHYGYCRGQEYVFSRWRQYALLEGQQKPYDTEEVDGKIVPYFRAERSGPDKILEDRKKTLIPFFGTYPKDIPVDWIVGKFIKM